MTQRELHVCGGSYIWEFQTTSGGWSAIWLSSRTPLKFSRQQTRGAMCRRGMVMSFCLRKLVLQYSLPPPTRREEPRVVGANSYTDNSSTNSVAWVRERTRRAERSPLLGEVGANFCCVVSKTHRYGGILGFLDLSLYCFFRVAPHMYPRGWVEPVSNLLFPRKFCSASNRIRSLWICSHELWPLDHRGGHFLILVALDIFNAIWIRYSPSQIFYLCQIWKHFN
jgi:hypothetical protein